MERGYNSSSFNRFYSILNLLENNNHIKSLNKASPNYDAEHKEILNLSKLLLQEAISFFHLCVFEQAASS